MTIEQQIKDAIADFHSLIAEGWETSAAVAEAAIVNGLKPGAFEQRLSKAMPIDALVDQIQQNADREHTNILVYNAVAEYCTEGTKWFKRPAEVQEEMHNSVEIALGHGLTSEERAQANTAYRQIKEQLSILFQREYERAMRSAQTGPSNAEDR
jgi:hypothetical protein